MEESCAHVCTCQLMMGCPMLSNAALHFSANFGISKFWHSQFLSSLPVEKTNWRIEETKWYHHLSHVGSAVAQTQQPSFLYFSHALCCVKIPLEVGWLCSILHNPTWYIMVWCL